MKGRHQKMNVKLKLSWTLNCFLPEWIWCEHAHVEKRHCCSRCGGLIYLWPVFPQSRFFSANRRFFGARANKLWQYCKCSFRKFDKFVEIWLLVYFNTGLVQNLGHINVFLELWTQLLKENLGTRRLTIKLEGTQPLAQELPAEKGAKDN